MGKISKKDENKEGFSEINIMDYWIYALIALIIVIVLIVVGYLASRKSKN